MNFKELVNFQNNGAQQGIFPRELIELHDQRGGCVKTVDLVIKNARIVRSRDICTGGIAVDDGKIVAICKDSLLPSADSIIDASGRAVLPGAIDAHVHVYIPGQLSETFETGTKAAAVGGVTTIIEMPSLDELLTTTVKNFEKKKAIGEKEACVDFALHAGEIQEKKDFLEIEDLVCAGAVGFKITMGGGSSTVKNDGIMFESFKRISEAKSVAIVHAENHQLYEFLRDKAVQKGENDPIAYSFSRPNIVEAEAISRAILFAKFAGNKLHVAHMTTKEGVELVRNAKDNWQPVTAEVTPQALLLNKKNYEKCKHYLIMNPPVREKEDNLALWKALNDGTVDCIVTDHCAYSKEEKNVGLKNIWDTPPGIPGLETIMGLLISEGVNKNRIELKRLVQLCCENPARIFGLYPRKGVIQVGSDADFMIIDLKKEEVIQSDKFQCIGECTPFEGWRIKGKPILTVVRGQIVADNGNIIGKPGYGKFIPSPKVISEE